MVLHDVSTGVVAKASDGQADNVPTVTVASDKFSDYKKIKLSKIALFACIYIEPAEGTLKLTIWCSNRFILQTSLNKM